MTELFNIVAKDSRWNDWLFFEEIGEGRPRIRPQYAPLVCKECQKVDELRALELPLPEIQLQGTWDVLGLMDGLMAVSRRFRDHALAQDLSGIDFRPFPVDSRYFLAVPSVFVDFDEGLSGFKRLGPRCSTCGRFAEVLVGPLAVSLAVPEDPLVVFSCKEWNEGARGRVEWLFATKEAIRRLKWGRFSGVEYIDAL